MRVYANHAYVVSDNNGAHGLQVFDLTRLRGVTTPQTFTADAIRSDFGRGHTIAINEATGFAYVAGSDACPAPTATGAPAHVQPPARRTIRCSSAACRRGRLHPRDPVLQLHRPRHGSTRARKSASTPTAPLTGFAIVDVSNKAAPVTLSSLTWTGAGYPHQAWFSADQRYALLNDELDESQFGHNARTLVFDLARSRRAGAGRLPPARTCR